MKVLGWDIGGVNTKVACVRAGILGAVVERPFELQREPGALVSLLRELAQAAGASTGAVHGVTLTAELSQMFRTKREGVHFVLDAVAAAFPGARVEIYTVSGGFVSIDAARADPLSVAAANWSATAHLAAAFVPDALLVDVGTTTTDIIPIQGGRVAAAGRTDPERLLTGELVYTGAVRTPVESLASHVPLHAGAAGVSAEGFALSGDVHVWRGDLAPADYTTATPDGRPATREYAGERLARVVCGDRDLIGTAAVTAIADALAHAQTSRIADAIRRVVARHPALTTALVTGTGAFLGRAAAEACGLRVAPLADDLGEDGARCAPAASVAILLARHRGPAPALPARAHPSDARVHQRPAAFEPRVVVKVGGGTLARQGHLDAVLEAIGSLAARAPVVVPGGGPFADVVRARDLELGLSNTAAHWMAILGMDQYAHLIADRLPGAALVEDRDGIRRAIREGRVPVVAPYRWLREADPLPHSWDVTSDSLAAWLAQTLGVDRLVLVKPAGAAGGALVDPCFEAAVGHGTTVSAVPADRLADLRRAIEGGEASEAG
jgi:probable H4MPT-linked C1 transfer pathway protein